MVVYIFGNEDEKVDKTALNVVDKIKKKHPDVTFVYIKPNQDVPFRDGENVIIMDVIKGLKGAGIFNYNEKNTVLPPRSSAHDYDLGFQLGYLNKLGKLGKVTIIGLPMTGNLDYKRIHSIFRKLVAQDIQGS